MKALVRACLVMLLPPVAASAQSGAASLVVITDRLTATQNCRVFDSGTLASSASCPVTAVTGGTGSSSSSVDVVARSASVGAHFDWDGSTVPTLRDEVSAGGSMFNRALHVIGYTGANTDFVFHYLISVSGGFTNANGIFDRAIATVNFGSSGTGSFEEQIYANGGTFLVANGDVVLTSVGADFTDHISPYSGNFDSDLVFRGGVTDFIESSQPFGASVDMALAISLGAIEVVDNDTGVHSWFTLDDDGGATWIGAITTPEPSTIALVAPGLLGVLGLSRRRRRRRMTERLGTHPTRLPY